MYFDVTKLDFLSQEIVGSLSKQEREEFFSKATSLFFKKGKMLFYEGGIPTGTFFIQSGSAKIYKSAPDGSDQIFYIYTPGDLLGYHALLCNEPYEDSCEALEDCEVWFVSKSSMENLLKEIPNLNHLLLKNMSHEFGVLVNFITIMAKKTLMERLAIYLLFLEKKFSMVGKAGIILPREDLANLIGTSRESLGRILKEFREEGLIEVKGRQILLINKDRLTAYASSRYGLT